MRQLAILIVGAIGFTVMLTLNLPFLGFKWWLVVGGFAAIYLTGLIIGNTKK